MQVGASAAWLSSPSCIKPGRGRPWHGSLRRTACACARVRPALDAKKAACLLC